MHSPVDIDEVLAKFLDALISYHNDTFGSSLALQDFHSYLFKDVWGGTYEEGFFKIFLLPFFPLL